jgi:hypothetical protein
MESVDREGDRHLEQVMRFQSQGDISGRIPERVINVQPRTKYSKTQLYGYWLRCRTRADSS